MTCVLSPAMPSDRVAVRALLSAAGLPIDDLDGAPLSFLVARDRDALVGAIAVEHYSDTGLLRSLAVADSHRRQGIGEALVDALENEARALGIVRLVLLTQTAAAYFGRRGYRITDRASVTGDVLSCAQFQSLCPASATCMVKSLG